MSVRSDKHSIPTVATGVDRFLAATASYKAQRDVISLLRGPAGRVIGKKAAGSSLASSSLGGLRMNRLETHDVAAWFEGRHVGLAQNTRKKNRAYVGNFLRYCETQGWVHTSVLAGLPTEATGDVEHPWLYPDTVGALTALVAEHFDPYRQFIWRTLLSCGLRPDEVAKLKRDSMNRREMRLVVFGKGGGKSGKRREVPVSPSYLMAWDEHIKHHGVAVGGWMFPRRVIQFSGGAEKASEWTYDHRHPVTVQGVRRWIAATPPNERDKRGEGLTDIAVRVLPPAQQPRGSITPQTLRRTYACLALIDHRLRPEKGWDLKTLQNAMGHSSLNATQLYLDEVDDFLGAFSRDFDAMDAAAYAAEALAARQKETA